MFASDQICSLGIQLVNILEQIHAAGYVYNDLKLDNLMLDYDVSKDNFEESSTNDIFRIFNVNIVDMGFATRYIDD